MLVSKGCHLHLQDGRLLHMCLAEPEAGHARQCACAQLEAMAMDMC